MKFNPSIHTKEFLLSNPEIAIKLADKSPAFAKHPLSQNFEILSIKDLDGWPLCYFLALEQPDWAQTEASQLFDVLTMKLPDNDSVAHVLAAYRPSWAKTMAAQDFDTLKISSSSGRTVAHELAARQSDWVMTDAAANIQVLSLRKNDGTTVAHDLAMWQIVWSNRQISQSLDILSLSDNRGKTVAAALAIWQSTWHQSDAAKSKDVLLLSCGDCLVAQEILARSDHKAKCLTNFVNVGFAYKANGQIMDNMVPKFDLSDLLIFFEMVHELLLDEIDDDLKLKKILTYYSTLKNICSDVKIQIQQDKLEEEILSIKNLIEELFQTSPDRFVDEGNYNQINFEPAFNLINQIKSERNLQQLAIIEPPALSSSLDQIEIRPEHLQSNVIY